MFCTLIIYWYPVNKPCFVCICLFELWWSISYQKFYFNCINIEQSYTIVYIIEIYPILQYLIFIILHILLYENLTYFPPTYLKLSRERKYPKIWDLNPILHISYPPTPSAATPSFRTHLTIYVWYKDVQ